MGLSKYWKISSKILYMHVYFPEILELHCSRVAELFPKYGIILKMCTYIQMNAVTITPIEAGL